MNFSADAFDFYRCRDVVIMTFIERQRDFDELRTLLQRFPYLLLSVMEGTDSDLMLFAPGAHAQSAVATLLNLP